MQRYISYNKFNKKILCILILFVMLFTALSFIPNLMIKSYANNTYTYKYNSTNNLPKNFDTTYPGYKSVIEKLAKAHPNWTFKLYETGLVWDTVINNEYLGHGSSPKNLVPSNYSSAWICPTCGKTLYDSGWYCASRGAIEHIMDPRNSINDATIFQYLLLSFDSSITKKQVEAMASKIDYLNTKDIKDAIYKVGKEYNINPFYIIGKILQEQGSNGSIMCKGDGYNGKHKGYYNLFNVGASGNGKDNVILNGLKYAEDHGWNTPEKAIIGGLGTIKSYITRGQDTLYYQKFNVVYKTYYVNQYAQNLFDAQSIGQTLKGYYNDANLLNSNFTFEIPLYKNMPSSAVKSPSVTSVKGELAYVNANGGLALRDSPGGNTLGYVLEGTQIVITKRASEKSSDGYYWDKVSTPVGTGYMAREALDGSKTWLMPIKEYEVKDSNIIVAPGATIKTIEGAKNTSKIFGTGAKITYEGKTYTLVMLGDVNGDGKIKASDYVLIKNYIMSTGTKLEGVKKVAADISRDSSIKASDYVLIKNYIMYGNKIIL